MAALSGDSPINRLLQTVGAAATDLWRQSALVSGLPWRRHNGRARRATSRQPAYTVITHELCGVSTETSSVERRTTPQLNDTRWPVRRLLFINSVAKIYTCRQYLLCLKYLHIQQDSDRENCGPQWQRFLVPNLFKVSYWTHCYIYIITAFLLLLFKCYLRPFSDYYHV